MAVAYTKTRSAAILRQDFSCHVIAVAYPIFAAK